MEKSHPIGSWKSSIFLLLIFFVVPFFAQKSDVYSEESGPIDRRGRRSGVWTTVVLQGNYLLDSGSYEKGKKTGVWIRFFNEKRDTDYVATYHKDREHGVKRVYNGSRQLTSLHNYRGGKLYGESRYYYSNGVLLSVQEFRNNRAVGEFRYWHENGVPASVQNFGTGAQVSYHPGGQLAAQGDVKERERGFWYPSGEWIWYHANGQVLRKGRYGRPGKREGEWKTWYASGQLRYTAMYKKGLRQGEAVTYTEKGTRSELPLYEEEVVTYFKNGLLQYSCTFENDLPNGHCKNYHENGVLRSEGDYKDGKETGQWKFYDETGKFVREEWY